MKRRVKLYQEYQADGWGAIIVQANVEDTRLGVQEYAVEKTRRPGRRAQVGPGGQGYRGRGQDPGPEEGADAPRAGLHRPARPHRSRRDPGLRAGSLQGVRAPLPGGHGHGRSPSPAGSRSCGRRGPSNILPQDRRLPARRPRPGPDLRFAIQARPSDRRRRRRGAPG